MKCLPDVIREQREKAAARDEAVKQPKPNPFASPDGRKNIYTCQDCRGHIVTRDADAGTTPFMIVCRATNECKGAMRSSFYRVWDGTIAATHEWYKPDGSQPMTLGEREHVRKGGLLLRRVAA